MSRPLPPPPWPLLGVTPTSEVLPRLLEAVRARAKLLEGDTVVGVRESVSGHDLARGIREGTASVPAWSSLSAGPHVTTGLLVADRVGLVPTTGDPDLEAIGSKVADRIKSVRREFRARLGSQELTETKPRWVCPKGGAA